MLCYLFSPEATEKSEGKMYPVIYKFGPVAIYSYGVMLAIGFGIAVFLLARQGKRQAIAPELVYNLCFILLGAGIIGARAVYVALNFNYYLSNPLEMVMFTHGGLSWFGGLIFGLAAALAYFKFKRLDAYLMFDLIAPFAALAQGIGRIGCFLNGCCFGKESARWGIYFPVHDAVLIPTQIYSSLALFVIFAVLKMRTAAVHRKGEILYLYLLLYSAWRFFIEFFRADTQIFFFGLSVFQTFCIVIFIASLFMLIRVRIKPSSPNP